MSQIFAIPDSLPPLGFRDVRNWLWFAGIGLLILLFSLFPNVVQNPWRTWIFLACLLAFTVQSIFKKRRSDPYAVPRKRMDAQLTIHALSVGAFVLGFVVWARFVGLAWPIIICVVLFFEALPNTIMSLSEWWRLSGIGLSVVCVAIGVGLPLVPSGSAGVLIGAAIVLGCLLSATILYWQIRRSVNLNAIASRPPDTERSQKVRSYHGPH
jgi:hypothetical protein